MKIKGYQDTIDWYEQNALDYAHKSQKILINDIQQLEAFAALLPSDARVLDAGCGGGRDSELLRKKGLSVVGVDISHNLIKQARLQYPDCDFQQGDMLQLPFEDVTFDGVWAHASIVHFDQDEQVETAVREIARVLAPEGVAHVLVRAQKDQKTHIVSDSLAQHKRFYKNFSQAEMRALLRGHNLEMISIDQYDESQQDPSKRPGEGIEWIVVLARKRR